MRWRARSAAIATAAASTPACAACGPSPSRSPCKASSLMPLPDRYEHACGRSRPFRQWGTECNDNMEHML